MKHLLRTCLLGWGMLLAVQSQAQPTPFCGTPTPPMASLDVYQRWVKTQRTARTALGSTAFVPVIFTFVRPASAQGQSVNSADYGDALRGIYWLEKAFRPGNLSFFAADFRTLDNDADFNREWNVNFDPTLVQRLPKNAVNVVVVPKIGNGYAGFAYYPSASGQPSNLIFMQYDYFPVAQHLLPHEMGHYFNLLHTFETGYGRELVDGTNCAAAGDLVCDTPADPFGQPGSANSYCTYTGTATDANGQNYRPDMQNLMAYWYTQPQGCSADHFTTGQMERAYEGYLVRRSNPGSGENQYDFSASGKDVVPINLQFTVENGQITLSWLPNNPNFYSKFLVEKAVSPEGPWTLVGYTDQSNGGRAESSFIARVGETNPIYCRVRHAISARYSEVAVYRPQNEQTLSFAAVSGKTFGDGPVPLTASSSSGLPVGFRLLSGPGSIVNGSQLQITGAGQIEVEAFQDGTTEFLPATARQTIPVSKAPQTLTVPAVSDKTFGAAPFTVSASSDRGLPVQWRVQSGPGAVSGDTVSLTGAGTVRLRAFNDGNQNYLGAEANLTFNVAKAAQTVAFGVISGKTFGDAPFDLPASASSGLPLSFTASGPARLAGNRLKMTGAGQITVTAWQPGNENYLPSNTASQSFSAGKAVQVVVLENLAGHTYLDPPIDLPDTASSGLPITFSVSGPARLNEGQLTPTGVGVVTVTASQPGNENYQPAPAVTRSFTIEKGAQVITFERIPTKTYGDAPFLLPVRLNSALSLNFTITGPVVFDGTRMRITGTGPVRITAAQPGDKNHLPAQAVTQEFTVEKAAQTLTFPDTALAFGPGTASLSATSSGNLPVQYSLVSGPATLAGNTLTFIDYGQITLRASQPGNENYQPAPAVTRTVCVNPDKPVVTFAPASDATLLSSSPFRNQWFRNGDTLRGATAPRLTVTQSGDYTVRVTNPVAECNATQQSDVKTVAITALSALPAEWKLEVSPNPVSDYLTVRLTATGVTVAPVCEVIDGLGRVLWGRKMDLAVGRYEAVVPVRGLAAGVYGVRVRAGGRMAVGRVVVE